MVTRLAIAMILSFVAFSSSYAHDSDRIEELERELQETKQRLSILESMLRKKQDDKEPVITGDGWKSIANWRKLTTGMSPGTVQKILGDPQRIDGGTIAIWRYENRGSVTFFQGKVDAWSEPR